LFLLVSCFYYSSTLKMETICSFERAFEVQQIVQRYIPEDISFHNHRCENLKYNIQDEVFESEDNFHLVPSSRIVELCLHSPIHLHGLVCS
jgi:hypothetical protein